VLLGVAGYFLATDPFTPKFVLPDGSRVKLMGMTVGSRHRMTSHSGLMRWLYPRLPKEAQQLIPTVTRSRNTLPGTGVVWFFHEAAVPKSRVRRRGASQFRFLVIEVAEPGHPFTAAGYYYASDGVPELYAINLAYFQRRLERLPARLVLTGPDGEHRVLGRFELPNPNPRTYPTWTPTPLPLRVETG
jgi:hypothetical protein